MKCDKCKNILFLITIISCCSDCSENDAWDPDEDDYTSDEKIIFEKSLDRTHVDEQGECTFGSAFGAGCYTFTCSGCKHEFNMPLTDGC